MANLYLMDKAVFKPKLLSVMIALITVGHTPLYAQETKQATGHAQHAQDADDEQQNTTPNLTPPQHTTIKTITVKGTKRATPKDNEVTGLGKIVKNSADLDKQQVSGIRDLVRYDAGISVVEQGRGATSGYAMRGVDKNRVGVVVDGLSQAQSYLTLFSKANGGAINEIEVEHIRSVELSKGASSSEYGNGALGGAVGFVSKDAYDVIKPNQNWGITTKTSYNSKNKQLMQSLATAVAIDDFEALAIYTKRTGEQTKIHHQADNADYEITRLSGYADVYDMRLGTAQNQYSNGWFIIKDECPNFSNCSPKPAVILTRPTAQSLRTDPPLSAQEAQNRKLSTHITEKLSATDYTGVDRIAPNPMQYRSDSWLIKGGYRPSPVHYIGAVFEHTAQRYASHDKSVPAYYLPSENSTGNRIDQNIYAYDNLLEGLRFNYVNMPVSLNWTRSQFFDERHQKQRAGLLYRYEDKDSWLNKAALSYDYQQISLQSASHDRRCAKYPAVDEHCRPTPNKVGSYYKSEKNSYSERHHKMQLDLQKSFVVNNTKHTSNLLAGIEKQQSTLHRHDYFYEYTKQDRQRFLGDVGYTPNGSYDKPYVYELKPAQVIHTNLCDDSGRTSDLSNCSPRIITGNNHFVAWRHRMSVGQLMDLGVGLRYDYHRYRSDDDWTASGQYHNWSYNGGINIKPNANLSLSYRLSSGFRVPAFYEMYGRRVQGTRFDTSKDFVHVGQFKPEKSLNHEAGFAIKGQFGYLQGSYFHNRYQDMIALAERRGLHNNQYGYHNSQDVKLHGVNVSGKIDWHGVNTLAPEGLYSTIAYNHTKLQERKLNPIFTNTTDPILDAIQPKRYVLGLGYDHPSGRWGLSHLFTYSDAKRDDELLGNHYVGNTTYNIQGHRSQAWQTHDVSGYIKPNDTITLRGAVYNLLNYKYSTWEAIRQSSPLATNPSTRQVASYAAPDRNFVLSLEMKF